MDSHVVSELEQACVCATGIEILGRPPFCLDFSLVLPSKSPTKLGPQQTTPKLKSREISLRIRGTCLACKDASGLKKPLGLRRARRVGGQASIRRMQPPQNIVGVVWPPFDTVSLRSCEHQNRWGCSYPLASVVSNPLYKGERDISRCGFIYPKGM